VATVLGCFNPPGTRLPLAGGTPSHVCGECHSAIYREWHGSAHASAYTREEFRVASRDYAETDCLRCHVPRSLDTVTGSPVRAAHRAEGVNCESCHLSGDAYAAPRLFSSHANHGLLKQEALAKSDFCGQCHEAIFEQWREARVPEGPRQTCQECHMPVVRRKTVSGSAWHLLHPRVDTRHHGFAMLKPEPGKPNVELVVALDHVSGSEVLGHVTVTNVSAHHSLPSGEFGFRELAVITALVDRYGIASVKQVDRFVAQKKRWLPYGEAQTLPFRFAAPPRDAAALQVKLVRSSYAGVEAVLSTFTQPLSASPASATTASATEK
jgi:hypothetical protein